MNDIFEIILNQTDETANTFVLMYVFNFKVNALPVAPTTRALLNKKSSSNFLSCTDQDCVKQFKRQNQLLGHLLKGNNLCDSDEADS